MVHVFNLLRQSALARSVHLILEAVWNATCREQDTIGIVIHLTCMLCDLCAARLGAGHAGKEPTQHVIAEAILAEDAFLLVCDCHTRVPAIIGSLPHSIHEGELLASLKQRKVMSVLSPNPGRSGGFVRTFSPMLLRVPAHPDESPAGNTPPDASEKS